MIIGEVLVAAAIFWLAEVLRRKNLQPTVDHQLPSTLVSDYRPLVEDPADSEQSEEAERIDEELVRFAESESDRILGGRLRL